MLQRSPARLGTVPAQRLRRPGCVDSRPIPIYRERVDREETPDMRNHDHHPTPPSRGERRYRPEWPDDVGGAPSFRGGHGGAPHHHGRPGGPPGPQVRGGWRGRGPRARGDVRAAILLLLDEQPRHGYELIQEIAERSSGAWAPSP